MRFLTILVLLLTANYILGQNYGADSHNIDDSEKKRLENQFKALGTFYIDDSGLVVYQKQASDNSSNTSPNKTRSEATTSYDSTKNKEQSENVPVVVRKTIGNGSAMPSEATSSESPYIDKAPVNTAYIKKESTAGTNEIKLIKEEEKEQPLPNKNKIEEDVVSSKAFSKDKAKSILNRKRTSKYKTMEEAALAVESLLEELKKEQVQTTSSGSMSSRLSRGVNKNLRKKAGGFTSNYNTKNYSSNMSVKKQETTIDDIDSEFGDEPSYFINGKQVEKIEVNKLRKKDIINKEIRIRNTVTGNPNGEVWYEVKEDALE